MNHIDYYFTVLSPWAFFGGKRFAQIADKHGVSVTFKPVDIGQLFTRTGGQLPKDRHPSRMEYRMQELKRWSKALDMPINLTPAHWPTNGAPASYAIIAAQSAGTGDVGALVDALMQTGRAGAVRAAILEPLVTERAAAASTRAAKAAWNQVRVGALADLAVLDRDPFAGPPEEVGTTRVLQTFVDGRRVYAAHDA